MPTQYRIITNPTYIADRYLQFKSHKIVREFPKFWKKKKIQVWRYIPDKDKYIIFGYIDEMQCPINLTNDLECANYISCFQGQENFSIAGVTWLPKKYPYIQEYFKEFNIKYHNYLVEKSKIIKGEITQL